MFSLLEGKKYYCKFFKVQLNLLTEVNVERMSPFLKAQRGKFAGSRHHLEYRPLFSIGTTTSMNGYGILLKDE